MATIYEIWVHCTATSPDWMKGRPAEHKRDEIDRWHKAKGWNGFGYNELIDRDGKIAKGRPIGAPTAAVRGHNSNAIHLVLAGARGAEADDRFEDHFTDAQRVTLLRRLRELQDAHPNAEIRGHNEVAAKGCPGFNVTEFLRENPLNEVVKPEPVAKRQPSLLAILRAIFGGGRG